MAKPGIRPESLPASLRQKI